MAEFERPLKISGGCLEDLKKVTIAGPNATTHIVFDEFDGSNMNPETILNLLTTDGWETLPARFKWVAHPQCLLATCGQLWCAGTHECHHYLRSFAPTGH